MSIWIAAGIAVGTAFLALYLRVQQKEIASAVTISAGVVLLSASLIRLRGSAGVFREILRDDTYGELTSVLLKGLGIAWITQIASDVCRETGEAALGTQIETFGRVEIALLALPLAARLLDFAGQLL